MSLTLNMVGGGGGGLKATDALLRVQAPAGSTVTISKDATTKTDLGHENADDHTIYDYYFIIHQSQFDSVNPWTITATRGSETASSAMIVDSADEYNLILSYHVGIGYQEVEYLQGAGDASLDIGYTPTGNSVIECTFSPIAASSGTCEIYGVQQSSSPWGGRRSLNYTNTSTLRMGYATTDKDVGGYGTYGTVYTSVADKNVLYINGTPITSASYSSFTSPSTLGLFNKKQGSNGWESGGTKRIYYFKLTENGVVQREMYPCYRKSDSVAGMYDRINNVFYSNVRGGTFTVGGDVN